MKAEATRQRALLEVQDADTRLAAVETGLRSSETPPELVPLRAEWADLAPRLREAKDALEEAEAAQKRAEDDVAVVEQRQGRDERLLHASSNGKEIQGIQAELASLGRRRSDLEDTILECMEKVEELHAAVAVLEEKRHDLRERVAGVRDEASRRTASLREEKVRLEDVRRRAAERAGVDLLSVYEDVRVHGMGVAAARLDGKVCGACGIHLGPADAAAIARRDPDDVVQCPQCDAILVRGV